MEKSPDAFRTISEVASDLDVPQHVLRFWETRFSQIRPMKRAGGRRYYRPEDVNLLRGIRALLYGEGYTIKGVQKILREQGVAHVSAIGSGDATPQKTQPAQPAQPAPMEAAATTPRRISTRKPQEAASSSPSPELSRARMEELQQALEEISAARRLLLRTLEEQGQSGQEA